MNVHVDKPIGTMMPYASTSKLPPAVQGLPPDAKKVFMRVFNEQDGRGMSEESCFRIAWTAVKNGWKKDGDAWVKKSADRFEATCKVEKVVDVEHRLVGGWVSIIHDGTNPVIDSQGDVIDVEELRSAIHDFVKVRVGKAMHAGEQVAELVELAVVDGTLRRAVGGPDVGPTGAWAVWKVHDDATWEKVKAGRFSGFSIGGRGQRLPMTE